MRAAAQAARARRPPPRPDRREQRGGAVISGRGAPQRGVGGDGGREVVEEDGEGGVEDPEARQSGVDLQTGLSEGEKVPRFEEPAWTEFVK